MKQWINSLIIAGSMYSKLPMPKTDWNKENMKYVMCFFPLIGVVIGAFVYAWTYLEPWIPMSRVFWTAIVIVIPIIITGGIHMDGLLDTADALSSYAPKEKKLEILKDSNSGAFAVITCVVYMILSFGIWYDANKSTVLILSAGFVLSRALSGLAVVTFPLAKDSGFVSLFSNEAHKKLTRFVMIFYMMCCAVWMIWFDVKLGILCLLGAGISFLYYRILCVKQFGGTTGDVAGYFLQICELVMALFVVFGGRLWY